MKFRRLGNSEIEISSIILGMWQAGKKMWAGIDDRESTLAVKTALDEGINTFDTAELYGNGHSERILGAALEGSREKVIYATKVSPRHLSYSQVIRACHRSMKNLKTDYIDLYQIHWPSGSWGTKEVPIEETMNAMNRLKEEGKIRAIGLSNFSRLQVEEASLYGEIQSVQLPYSIFWRHIEKDVTSFCAENSLSILAYSSMAQGILTGKFGEGHIFDEKDHRSRNRLFSPSVFPRVQDALERLRPIARRNHITLGQLALGWVISHSNTCAIAGARNSKQVSQNSRAVNVFLSAGDLNEIDLISRQVTDLIGEDPVMWK
ncbi:MAG: aldo/keto reductase [Deltaproteobacteria bacterium]|nr:aldo/keto reductase [Deltaproteobacteria bacterium]